MIAERWRPVGLYEGLYEVSDLGRVRSLGRVVTDSLGRVRRVHGRVLRPGMDGGGHLSVALYGRQGECRSVEVHLLVLATFVGPRPPGLQGLHRSDDPAENEVGNLYYGTPSQNSHDAVRNGRHHESQLDRDPHGHLYSGANLWMNRRRGGGPHRKCRACSTASRWAGQHRRRGNAVTVEQQAAYADARYREYMAEEADAPT